MKKQEAIQLLKLMGVPSDTIGYSHGWVRSSCPLAPATHAGGTDNNPSFGIKVSDDLSYFNCFSCGSGTVSGLIHRFNFDVGYIPSVNKFYGDTQYNIRDTHRLDYDDRFTVLNSSEPVNKLVPDKYLERFPLLEKEIGGAALRVKEWLLNRGISLPVAYKYKTRFDVYGNIIFPIIDKEENIYALQFRSTRSKKFWFFRDDDTGEEFPKGCFWYGGQFLAGSAVLLVESQTDVLRLKTMGVRMPVLASCGSVTYSQLSTLHQNDYYLGYDNDGPGEQKKRKTISELQSSASRIFVIDWGTVNRKDAGELDSINELREAYDRRFLVKGGDEILKDIDYREKFEPNK